MGVVSTTKIDPVAHHALKAHPDVGLDVFHDVTHVEFAIGIGQGGGDEELAGGRCSHKRSISSLAVKTG